MPGNLFIYPVLDEQFHIVFIHPCAVSYPDLGFQHIKDGSNRGKIGLGTGETARLFKVQHDQLVQVRKLAREIDDALKGHAARDIRLKNVGR